MWLTSRLVRRVDWAQGLATLCFDRALSDFAPGQFINLALPGSEERETRSYSVASAAGEPVEVFVTLTEEGDFTPRLFNLSPGDAVELQDKGSGFFTLEWVPDAVDLWLVATGTGLAPFISMLRSGRLWSRFERVIVVHGVRLLEHLAYQQELRALGQLQPVHYGALVTREEPPVGGEVVRGRIPSALADGSLEARLGVALDPARSHVMLCGNPAMITDVVPALETRGLHMHRRRKPGHITTEKYW